MSAALPMRLMRAGHIYQDPPTKESKGSDSIDSNNRVCTFVLFGPCSVIQAEQVRIATHRGNVV